MTLIQILAVLSVLTSFGVDAATVSKVHDILIPPVVTMAPTYVPATQSTFVENTPVFGNTQPTNNPQVETPTAVVPLLVVDPLTISNVEVSPGGYLRVFTNKSLASATVSQGTLADPLIDNYLMADGKNYPGHVYEYKLTGAQRPFIVTLADDDGQVVISTVK